MSLSVLANEILLFVAKNLTRESDINSLARTNRRLYFAINHFLYRFAVRRGNNACLRWSAFHGYFHIVRMLLDLGANVRNALRDSTHRTALHLASAQGHLRIVEALLQSGANVNAVTTDGTTALHEAVPGGFEDITRVLLENGAKKLPYQNRPTVLHIACCYGHTAIVNFLLKKGMSTEVKDADFQTPLHYAVGVEEESDEIFWSGNLRTIECLLERGANKNAWDKQGRRPKDLAADHPCTAVEIIFQNGSDMRVSEAIQIEHQLAMKKEQEQAKIRKVVEIADERAAKRIARLERDAGKLKIEISLEEAKDQRERSRAMFDRIFREQRQRVFRQSWSRARIEADREHLRRQKLEDARAQQLLLIESIVTNERQDASRHIWSRIKEEAEQRSSHQPLGTIRRSTCIHPFLGWLKCKGRTHCDNCGRLCAKSSFKCGDCGIGVCLMCKTNGVSSKV